MAPDDMPNVMPPMAKNPTRNITLIKPAEMPNAVASPDNTPPKILSLLFRCIISSCLNNYD
jgi:hypothetical protein